MSTKFLADIDYDDDYVQPLVISALKSRLPESSFSISDSSAPPSPESPLLQFRQYEKIDFETALQSPSKILTNAYIIRKALIRKHYLSTTISNWTTKYPASVLKTHFKQSVEFELDYAEFLDDALVEAFELHESFMRNDYAGPEEKEWWILKPGMSDRGQEIRLFSTFDELQAIFAGWEEEAPDSEEEDDGGGKDGIVTSQLRHFVAQPYILRPLLLDSEGNRKFHIRTYVLAVGALKVYVYVPMLALFAPESYVTPGHDALSNEPDSAAAHFDLRVHLTNTCLQGTTTREGSVRAFWDLDSTSGPISNGPTDSSTWKAAVFEQICIVTAEVFEAAARSMTVHFQPLPNAFEVFGLDFLVDADGQVFLLEVNAFPDFCQTGARLQGLVSGLFEEIVDVAVKPFFGLGEEAANGTERMRKVLDIDLGRR